MYVAVRPYPGISGSIKTYIGLCVLQGVLSLSDTHDVNHVTNKTN